MLTERIAKRYGETLPSYPGIMPGDVVWDEGGGLIGFLIRLVCLGSYAHCLTVTGPRDGDGTFATVEAYPGGVKLRHDRDETRCLRVMRLWRNEEERQAIIDAAKSHVGRRYAYGELLAIALNRIGIKVNVPDREGTMICSNSVAAAVLAARPDVQLSRRPDRVWPARLERDLARQVWVDAREREAV